MVILPDGAADEPTPRLRGQTPLQAARIPHIQKLAQGGRVGTVVTVPPGFTPGSEVATLSLFGYDPRTDFPGRAPMEAAARGIAASVDQLIFRCNFVTIRDGCMADFTAGHIAQAESQRLVESLNEQLRDLGCKVHAGVSYRNLLVLSDASSMSVKTTAPHDIPNQPIDEFLPRGDGSERVREVMERAGEVLRAHEVNDIRARRGENAATDIWLWGQGQAGKLQPFEQRFGVNGAAIAAVDLIRGIAKLAGIEVLDVAGATGYLDTDYAAKGRAAIEALANHDIVLVHIEAPDEAGHLGDADAKVLALERIDEYIVGPVIEKLKSCYADWRMLIAPDHPTPVDKKVHTSAPPPFCIGGSNVVPGPGLSFDEASALKGLGIDPGHLLMKRFLQARFE